MVGYTTPPQKVEGLKLCWVVVVVAVVVVVDVDFVVVVVLNVDDVV